MKWCCEVFEEKMADGEGKRNLVGKKLGDP